MPRRCELQDLGRLDWETAFDFQKRIVEQRKREEICDRLLFVEHPHVVTMGRNGQDAHLLASPELLERSGIRFFETDRGGDVTYHGPGQIVGYSILDLRAWKRDVKAYVRAVEQILIDALGDFGICASRVDGLTGVWVEGAKIAAIGVHISRWVTSHGFALNVDSDLTYFQYIVPCGLSKPVTSMHSLDVKATRGEVLAALARHFARIFDFDLKPIQFEEERAHALAS